MSVIEAVTRMHEIESTLARLFDGRQVGKTADVAASAGASASGAAGATTSGTADLFAQAMAATGASSPTSAVTVPNPGDATGVDVIASAKKYLGVPYVFGGTDTSGMDCSGLVQRTFSDLGVTLPRVVSDQMKLGTEVPSLAEAKAGDLIVLDGGEHIVIYAGDNKIIHAPYAGKDVVLRDAYFKESDITTIRRIVPSDAAGLAAAGLAAAGLAAAGVAAAGSADLATAARAALLRAGIS